MLHTQPTEARGWALCDFRWILNECKKKCSSCLIVMKTRTLPKLIEITWFVGNKGWTGLTFNNCNQNHTAIQETTLFAVGNILKTTYTFNPQVSTYARGEWELFKQKCRSFGFFKRYFCMMSKGFQMQIQTLIFKIYSICTRKETRLTKTKIQN